MTAEKFASMREQTTVPRFTTQDAWNPTQNRTLPSRHHAEEARMGRYFLLWMIGIPIPVLALIWMFGGLH